MKILGWIREDDKAACGGTVIEGLQNSISNGRAMSYEGAMMACRKNCRIGEAHPAHTLSNGRHQPHHGHRTMPGMCPLMSTLNDIHGRGNETGKHVPAEFVEHDGEWIEANYDEQFQLRDEVGNTLSEMPYTIKLSNQLIQGVTDQEGKTGRYKTDGAQKIELHIGHVKHDN
jgi:uncharacterized Zn-binding protein involved in type VI secretion